MKNVASQSLLDRVDRDKGHWKRGDVINLVLLGHLLCGTLIIEILYVKEQFEKICLYDVTKTSLEY